MTHALETGLLDPFVEAVEIGALLAIELHDRRDIFERLLLGLDVAEEVRRAHMQSSRARNVDVVTAVDADDADVLDGRFGAIARTAGDGELHFGRCPGAAKQPFELDAEAGRILRAETAPLLADASLHRTQALGVGMTRD